MMRHFLKLIALATISIPCLCFGQPCTPGTNCHTDIVLEGPWILYEDQQFVDYNGNTVTALIALAPYGDDKPGSSMFHRFEITNGDGYQVSDSGIYCLSFIASIPTNGNDPCKFNWTNVSLLALDPNYPTPPTSTSRTSWLNEITVANNISNKRWQWAMRQSGTKTTPVVALILPMPDTYTNDDEWYMRFGKKFVLNPTGNDYTPGDLYAIGVSLHYLNGSKYFDLRHCSYSSGNNPAAKDCHDSAATVDPHNSVLNNTGLLRIQMKAPNGTDGCDQHVRMAYWLTREILGEPVDHEVVDPAYWSDGFGKVSYDNGPNDMNSPGCLANDYQVHPHAVAVTANSAETTAQAHSFLSLASQLKGDFNQLGESDPDKDKRDESYLLAGQITTVLNKVDPTLPRISQLEYLGQLLKKSSERINLLRTQLTSLITAGWIDKQVQQDLDANKIQPDLATLEKRLKVLDQTRDAEVALFIYAPPTKDAKDCRAAIMHVVHAR